MVDKNRLPQKNTLPDDSKLQGNHIRTIINEKMERLDIAPEFNDLNVILAMAADQPNDGPASETLLRLCCNIEELFELERVQLIVDKIINTSSIERLEFLRDNVCLQEVEPSNIIFKILILDGIEPRIKVLKMLKTLG